MKLILFIGLAALLGSSVSYSAPKKYDVISKDVRWLVNSNTNEIAPRGTEVCIEIGCYIVMQYVSTTNRSWKEYRNKLSVYFTAEQFDLDAFSATVKPLLGYYKAIDKVTGYRVNQDTYGKIATKFKTDSFATTTDKSIEELENLQYDLADDRAAIRDAAAKCLFVEAACLGGVAKAAKSGNLWGTMVAVGACVGGNYYCYSSMDAATRSANKTIARLAKLRQRMEREANNNAGGGNSGGGGSPNTPDPGAGGPIITPVPGGGADMDGNVDIIDCPNGVCPHRP